MLLREGYEPLARSSAPLLFLDFTDQPRRDGVSSNRSGTAMAKFCENCKQPYPDNQPSCPRCTTTHDVIEVNDPRAAVAAMGGAPDDSVDLNKPRRGAADSPGHGEGQDSSIAIMASLVEDATPAGQSQPDEDGPERADLHRTQVDLDADNSPATSSQPGGDDDQASHLELIDSGREEDSAVDLASQPEVVLKGPSSGGSDEVASAMELVEEATAEAQQPAPGPDSESWVELDLPTSEMAKGPGSGSRSRGSSVVDLIHPLPPSEVRSSDVEVVGSRPSDVAEVAEPVAEGEVLEDEGQFMPDEPVARASGQSGDSSHVNLGGPLEEGVGDSFDVPMDLTDVLTESQQPRTIEGPVDSTSGVNLSEFEDSSGEMPTDPSLGPQQGPVDVSHELPDHRRARTQVDEDEDDDERVDLSGGSRPAKPPSRPSRDLIAETLESGVNLDRGGSGGPIVSPTAGESDSALDDYPMPPETSEVNLGGHYSKAGADYLESAARSAEVEEIRSDADILAGEEPPRSADSMPNLPKVAVPPDKAGKKTRARDEDVLDEEPAGEEEESVLEHDTSALEEPEEELAPAADEEELEPEPRKRAEKKWAGSGMLVGSALGLVLGAGAIYGLQAVNVLPRKEVTKTKELRVEVPVPEKPPEHVAAWQNFIRQSRGAAAKPDPNSLIDQLKAQDDVESVVLLGQLYEEIGQQGKALEVYQEGKKNHKDHEALFEMHIERIKKPDGSTRLQRGSNDLFQIALLLAALQGGDGADQNQKDPPDKKEPPEAGISFWKALKAARGKDYAAALIELQKAREAHDQRRLHHLRQAQNPLSDPTEKIFLESCAELEAHWRLLANIEKYRDDLKLQPATTPTDTLKAMAASGGASKPELDKAKADLQDVLTAVAKALKGENVEKPALAAQVKKLYDDKTTAETERAASQNQLAAVAKVLQVGKVEKPDVAAAAKKLVDDKAAAEKARTVLMDEVATVQKALKAEKVQREELDKKFKRDDAMLGKAVELIKAADVAVQRSDVLPAIMTLVELAKKSDPEGRVKELLKQIDALKAQAEGLRKPAELLDVWQRAAQNRTFRDNRALEDADRVLNMQGITADTRGRALLVKGLILRNQGKGEEAVQALNQALGQIPVTTGWRGAATTALRQLQDPSLYYAAEDLRTAGDLDGAIARINEGLKLFPNNGLLLARRGQAQLDRALRGEAGLLAPDNPAVAAVKADAEAALAAGEAADGSYLLGQLAEAQGNWTEALKNYQKADAARPNTLRYQLARARALWNLGKPPSSTPVGRLEPLLKGLARDGVEPLAVAMLLVNLQAPGGQPLSPRAEEAIKLANQILASKDATYIQRAEAQAILGDYTKALQELAMGLKADALAKGSPVSRQEVAALLKRLIDEHPSLRVTTGRVVLDPLQAEQFYAAGLRKFWERRYPEAEKEFQESIRNYDQDARYYYYLGLAKLMQNKREDAYKDFEQGARLEQQGRPNRDVVNAALERIQGRSRQILNSKRD
jgi:TolA-binding protein